MLTSDIFSENDICTSTTIATTSLLANHQQQEDQSLSQDLTPCHGSTTQLESLRSRQEWIKQIRLAFCVRPDAPDTRKMIHQDGTLNQEYFRPSKECLINRPIARSWTEKERELLIKGIEEFGIGHFRDISEKYLNDWSPNDLRVKTMRLIGRQNLQLYKDWKGNEQAILAEYERNKQIGLSLGYWKNAVLVYDDGGKVLEALLQQQTQL